MFRVLSFLCISLSVVAALSFQQKSENMPQEGELLVSVLENDEIVNYEDAVSRSSITPDEDGHFRTNTIINGRSLRMLVDTGASMVAISRADAEKLGYHFANSDFNRSGKSATGKVRFVEVNIPEMTVGDITVKNVSAAIIDRYRMPPLLGMTFISRLKKMEISNNMLHFNH